MPRVTFSFSEPQKVSDSLSKGDIDDLVRTPFAISGHGESQNNQVLRLDLVGRKEAIELFAKHLNPEPDSPVPEEATNEILLKRSEPETEEEAILSPEEDFLGDSNLLINIFLEQDEDSEVEIDIDPPIRLGRQHVYTFSSFTSSAINLEVLVEPGKVGGQVLHGAEELVGMINSLTEDNDIFTSFGEDGEKVEDFLKAKSDFTWRDLTPESSPQATHKKMDLSIPKSNNNEVRYYALIITGENSRSKYRLIGKIRKGFSS